MTAAPLPGNRYVGRFAPSPTGPLHLGSLATAAASFLHARQHAGKWLVRIEDIDPPRTVAGSARSILNTLETLGLTWDSEVVHQGDRFELYRQAADRLETAGYTFRCRCSRRELREAGNPNELGIPYPGTCRDRQLKGDDLALRVIVPASTTRQFHDGICGTVSAELAALTGDFVIWRRDSLPAYHLAVIVDDQLQGITHIVRGQDLLQSTLAQQHLNHLLGYPDAAYWHVPIIVDKNGEKLAKRHTVANLDLANPGAVCRRVLQLIGSDPPAALAAASPAAIWEWAIEHWDINQLGGKSTLSVGEATPLT